MPPDRGARVLEGRALVESEVKRALPGVRGSEKTQSVLEALDRAPVKTAAPASAPATGSRSRPHAG